MKDFTFKVAENEQEKRDSFYIRWMVYGQEEGFIDPAKYPDQVFYDEFDDHSLQVVSYHKDQPVGSARLILDSSLGFMIENYFNIEKKLNRQEVAEISRSCVRKEYRGKEYRRGPSIELLKKMYEASRERGIKYWYVILGDKLKNSFIRLGADFKELKQFPLTELQKEKRLQIPNYWSKVNAKPYVLDLEDIQFLRKF